MAAIPKKATTVILLKEKIPDGFGVFLLKRHEKSSFMGGNYVYPGGRVEQEDERSEIVSLCKGISPEKAHQIFGGSIPPDESIAYWVAGIRELFEEAGVLFAYDPLGKPFLLQDPTKHEGYRHLLQKKKMTLFQLAQEENISFALDQLHYYTHWITPEARPERFDTRFFFPIIL